MVVPPYDIGWQFAKTTSLFLTACLQVRSYTRSFSLVPEKTSKMRLSILGRSKKKCNCSPGHSTRCERRHQHVQGKPQTPNGHCSEPRRTPIRSMSKRNAAELYCQKKKEEETLALSLLISILARDLQVSGRSEFDSRCELTTWLRERREGQTHFTWSNESKHAHQNIAKYFNNAINFSI